MYSMRGSVSVSYWMLHLCVDNRFKYHLGGSLCRPDNIQFLGVCYVPCDFRVPCRRIPDIRFFCIGWAKYVQEPVGGGLSTFHKANVRSFDGAMVKHTLWLSRRGSIPHSSYSLLLGT